MGLSFPISKEQEKPLRFSSDITLSTSVPACDRIGVVLYVNLVNRTCILHRRLIGGCPLSEDNHGQDEGVYMSG